MLAKVCSAAVNGIDAYPVEVEVNADFGDTLIVIVVNKTPKPFVGLPQIIPPAEEQANSKAGKPIVSCCSF
jgi:hypothetical protein